MSVMAIKNQNNGGRDAQTRYNLRERKQITITVTSQEQQLAHLVDVQNPHKRKRAHSSAYREEKTASKLTFLDLPPELRNEIYMLVLYARPRRPTARPKYHLPHLDTKRTGVQIDESKTKELRNFQRWQMEVANMLDPIDGYIHYDGHARWDDQSRYIFHLSPGLYSPCSIFVYYRPDDDFKIDTLWHKDPALWQVNRQMRREAHSLHVAKFVSFDVRGTDRALSWSVDPRINAGLSRFEHWFTKRLDEHLQRSITRLELRDHVQAVASPIRIVADKLAADNFYRSNGGFVYEFVPAFQLEISGNSQVFKVRTPLELIPSQAAKLQAKLDHIVLRKTQQAQQDQQAAEISFDGLDIAECVRFLRGSASWPEIAYDKNNMILSGVQDYDERYRIVNSWSSVRFSMIISKEGEREMFLGLGSRRSKHNCTFEYVAATVHIPSNAQK